MHSDKPIKSIELQLVRVETCGEPSEVQILVVWFSKIIFSGLRLQSQDPPLGTMPFLFLPQDYGIPWNALPLISEIQSQELKPA